MVQTSISMEESVLWKIQYMTVKKKMKMPSDAGLCGAVEVEINANAHA